MNNKDEEFDDPIMDLKTKKMKNDILLFKNETLKELKQAQNKMFEKYSNLDNIIKDKFEVYEQRINSYELKISELSKLINADNILKEKVEQLFEFKDKVNDKIMTEKIRLDNFRNDLKANVSRIDKILTDSVIYPGIIGGISKYKTFHDLIDYVLTQCSLNLTFREKNILDLKSYKTKLEGLIEVFNNQVNKILSTTQEYTNTSVTDCESRMKSMLSILEDRMSETRIENANYAIGLEKISKNLQSELNNVLLVKKDLYKKFDSSIANIKSDNTRIIKLFSGYKKGFNLLEHKFTQLSEFIKDMRFRINLKEDVQRREFSKMSDLINFDKKKKGFFEGMEDPQNMKGFESQLKDYISGKITAEELLKKYNSFNDIKRKSISGSINYKKFNSFTNNFEEDKNTKNNLMRGTMANPRKIFSLDNDINKNQEKRKNEEIKEEDDENFVSDENNNNDPFKKFNLKKNFSINKNLSNLENKEKEKDDFNENLYEDVNEEEKTNSNNKINSNKSESKENNIYINKSKHGRGSIKNNVQALIKAEKFIKNLKKIEKPFINMKDSELTNREKNNNNSAIINISQNNIENNSSLGEINNNIIIKSENNNNNMEKQSENNNNVSSIKNITSTNFRLKGIGDQILNNKNKATQRNGSADKYFNKNKEKKYKNKDKNKEKDKNNIRAKILKNRFYDSEYILPNTIVHNATIFAYNTNSNSNPDFFGGRKKLNQDKKISNISEIKSVGNLILTSFYPKNGQSDINVNEERIFKLSKKNMK